MNALSPQDDTESLPPGPSHAERAASLLAAYGEALKTDPPRDGEDLLTYVWEKGDEWLMRDLTRARKALDSVTPGKLWTLTPGEVLAVLPRAIEACR